MAKKNDASAIQKVLNLISSGKSVRESCKEIGVKESTFRLNVDAAQYARARESCADRQFEEMEDLERQCMEKEIAPDVFRVVMDSRKWRLARMKPRVYGDKQAVDVNANVNILTQEQIDAMVRAEKLGK